MYMYMYIYIYIYICKFIYIYICTYICIDVTSAARSGANCTPCIFESGPNDGTIAAHAWYPTSLKFGLAVPCTPAQCFFFNINIWHIYLRIYIISPRTRGVRCVWNLGWRCLMSLRMTSRLLKLYVSFAKKPYKRDDILQKRPIIKSMLLTGAY